MEGGNEKETGTLVYLGHCPDVSAIPVHNTRTMAINTSGAAPKNNAPLLKAQREARKSTHLREVKLAGLAAVFFSKTDTMNFVETQWKL